MQTVKLDDVPLARCSRARHCCIRAIWSNPVAGRRCSFRRSRYARLSARYRYAR